MPTDGSKEGTSRLALPALLALTAALYGVGLGARSLWSEEVRWAAIPREMRQSGNYLRPTINGHTYYDKPLGSYWLVLAAAWATGSLDEQSARLPCAVSGVIGVGLLVLIARRLYDLRTALLAGVVLATSFSFVFFSRHASADVENVCGTLLALWLFLRNRDRPGGWWVLLFWLVMAFTSLTKGLLGYALPLLVAGTYQTFCAAAEKAIERSRIVVFLARNRWLFNGKTLLALPLSVGVYLAPFLLSADGWTDGLGMVYRENIRRFFDPVNHRGPVYLYGGVIFLLAAPWSVLLPAALAQARRGRDGFALAYFWSVFIFFTLSSSRRSYYLLPILPAVALLVASLLTQPRASLGRVTGQLLRLGCGVLALALLAAGVLLVPPELRPAPWHDYPPLPHSALFAAGWVASFVVLGFCLARFQPVRLGRALAAIAFVFLGYGFLVALPAAEAYRTQRTFVDTARQEIDDRFAQLALFRHRESIFYFGAPGPVPEYSDVEDLSRAVRDGSVRWVLLRQRDRDRLPFPVRTLVAEDRHAWESAEQVAAKLLLVRVEGE
jgi:4-amino-4-deoxy-L-arabinose transferase-like glycosyltransferase